MNDKHLRVWFVVFVVAVFAAGAGAGSLLERYLRPPLRAAAPGGPHGRGGVRDASGAPAPGPMMHRQLTEELKLTADQQKRIDEIFASRRERVEKIRSEINARFESEQREFRDEIRKVLTPEQQKRFDQWLMAPPMFGPRHMPGRGMGPGMGPGRGMGPGAGRGLREPQPRE